jgi:hypothetical protein
VGELGLDLLPMSPEFTAGEGGILQLADSTLPALPGMRTTLTGQPDTLFVSETAHGRGRHAQGFASILSKP